MIARLEWINPLEEEAAKKTISSSRRKGGSRAKVKRTELPRFITEAQATTPGMKGMPGEMPSASYAPFESPLTGGARQRIGGKWTDRFNLKEEIRQSNIVPQEDRLNAEQSKISLELDRKRNLSNTQRVNELINNPNPRVVAKESSKSDGIAEPGESKVDKSGYSWVDRVQEKLGYDRSNAPKSQVKTQELPKAKTAETGRWSTVFTKKDPKTGEALGVMTRNERKAWERANPKLNPKWDEAYTPKSQVKPSTQQIIENKVNTDEIKKNIEDTKANTKKTSLENIGSSIFNQTKVGSAYNKVKQIADIAKSLKTVGAAKTLKTAMAGLNPITLIASMAINAAKQSAQGTGASSGTGYREIDKGQEYDEWNYLA